MGRRQDRRCDQAQDADRAKSQFLAALSHELRTPLNAIIGFSEIIKDECIGPVGNLKYREYSSDIYESGLHLLDLINDILDLAKIESGTDKLDEDKTQIPEIIRSALMLVGQRAEQSGVKLELELADRLPALRADHRKLKQILVNLLSNAVKFTPEKGYVTVGCQTEADGSFLMTVSDTGIGIAAEDMETVFEKFGQADGSLERKFQGTGLGLSLVKSMVELHGGTFGLESEVGIGTRATVRFPAERVIWDEDMAAMESERQQAAA